MPVSRAESGELVNMKSFLPERRAAASESAKPSIGWMNRAGAALTYMKNESQRRRDSDPGRRAVRYMSAAP